jgi:NADH-quinone oxidoreductase subunit M
MTVLAAWQFSHWIAVVAATGVILTAGYILWTLQRVFLGVNKSMAAQGHDATHGAGEHGAEHGHELPDITSRELLCAVPLLAMAILLGIYPNLLFSFMENSVTSLVLRLHGTATEVASVVGHLVR